MDRMPPAPPPTTNSPVPPPSSSCLPSRGGYPAQLLGESHLSLMLQGKAGKAIGGRGAEWRGLPQQDLDESGRRDLNPGPSGPKQKGSRHLDDDFSGRPPGLGIRERVAHVLERNTLSTSGLMAPLSTSRVIPLSCSPSARMNRYS